MDNRGLYILILVGCVIGTLAVFFSWQNEPAVADINQNQPVKRIALTFDDGPGHYTEELLDGLKERSVKASFFILGTNAESHRDIIERMYDEGHVIGNHTYNHVQLSKMENDKAREEVTKTNDLIYNITGGKVKYIRPPYGEWNDELDEMVDMTVVLWNIDPLDWSTNNTDKIVEHIVENADDGSIVLLHDIFETSVDAGLEVIDKLEEEGFEFVTVEELIEK